MPRDPEDCRVDLLMDMAADDIEKFDCPICGLGEIGKDSLCDDCYREYLGTHRGGRSDDAKEYRQWCLKMQEKKHGKKD